MLANNSAISEVFQRFSYKFDAMYSKRAFVHWIVGDGMEKNEFACCREDMQTIFQDFEECAGETKINDLESN